MCLKTYENSRYSRWCKRQLKLNRESCGSLESAFESVLLDVYVSQANDWNWTVHHTAMMRLYGFQQHLLIFVKAGIAHHIPWGFNGIIFPDGFWIIQFSLAVCMSVPPAMATNYQNDCKQDPSPFPWAAMEAWWLDQPTETVDHWTSQTMTGQILETSACQRVGTVLALKFKPVCQVSSAC